MRDRARVPGSGSDSSLVRDGFEPSIPELGHDLTQLIVRQLRDVAAQQSKALPRLRETGSIDRVRFAIAAMSLRVLARIEVPIWPGMTCSARPQGPARAVDAEKLACARSMVTKRLALREAAIRLKVGKSDVLEAVLTTSDATIARDWMWECPRGSRPLAATTHANFPSQDAWREHPGSTEPARASIGQPLQLNWSPGPEAGAEIFRAHDP